MKTNVIMIEKKADGSRSMRVVFPCADSVTAMAIADSMNHLNREAARLSGLAIRFTYALLPASKSGK